MKNLIVLVPLAAVVACTIPPRPGQQEEKPEPQAPVKESPPLPTGTYQVQSVSYDDATGAYELFLLNPPAGASPKHTTTNLRFQRLTDEEVAAGEKAKLVVADGAETVEGETVSGPVAHLTPDFQINYTHNVVEDRGGQPVVVRQEHSMWSPFLTGMLVGHMFSPMFFYPPMYRPGAPMTGVGGFGGSRALAESTYTKNMGTPPQSSKLAKTGFSKMPSAGLKASGQGAGSSRLSGGKPSTPTKSPGRRSFGGGFGRRR